MPFHRLGHIILSRSFNPILFNEFIFSLTKRGRESKKALKIIQGFTDGVIERRKAAIEKAIEDEQERGKNDDDDYDKKREPFLDTLIREHLREPLQFTLLNIRDEVETFMFEGHDTTAWGVIWAVYIIGLYPECQQRIHFEVDSLYEAQNLTTKSYTSPSSSNTTSSDINHNDHVEYERQASREYRHMHTQAEDQDLTLDDLKLRLPYTEACVKEAQRLYPSVSVFTRQTESDFKINPTTTVPAGVNIAIFPSLIHMNGDYFPDPERFRPERFLSKEKRHPFAFIPFSAGPRNCIGQKFALLEEKALLAMIFRKFKVTSLDPRESVVPCASLITKSKGPIRVRLEARI